MKKPTFVCLAVCALGCSAIARSPEQYRDDTHALLETRNAQIKQCYDDALKTDASLSGQVTVTQAENSDVGPRSAPGSDTVAVAVTTWPTGTAVVSAVVLTALILGVLAVGTVLATAGGRSDSRSGTAG